jgi:hypothetical protein
MWISNVKCRERLSAGMEPNRKFTGETQTTLYCDVTELLICKIPIHDILTWVRCISEQEDWTEGQRNIRPWQHQAAGRYYCCTATPAPCLWISEWTGSETQRFVWKKVLCDLNLSFEQTKPFGRSGHGQVLAGQRCSLQFHTATCPNEAYHVKSKAHRLQICMRYDTNLQSSKLGNDFLSKRVLYLQVQNVWHVMSMDSTCMHRSNLALGRLGLTGARTRDLRQHRLALNTNAAARMQSQSAILYVLWKRSTSSFSSWSTR